MIVLIVLLIATLIARAVGAWRKSCLNAWPAAVRVGLAVMFLFTALSHFVPTVRDEMIRMVPPSIPNPGLVVAFTGLCEVLGAIGLLIPGTRALAAWALILFLTAVFPANVRAAREGLTVGGRPATPLVPRAAMQLVLIGLVWWSGVRKREVEPAAR